MLKNIRCWNCHEWVELEDAFDAHKTNEGLIVNHYNCPECDATICVDVTGIKENNAKSK